MLPTRLVADRRRGSDRRAAPRRRLVPSALSIAERRRQVDRRRGAERRSTLDRRGRGARAAAGEAPAEHLRNALQLLAPLAESLGLSPDERGHLEAALERVQRALAALEHRPQRR